MQKKKLKKIFLVLLSILFLIPLLQTTTSKSVSASSTPKDFSDAASNFAHYGSLYASSSKTSSIFKDAGNVWNYFGPSGDSILSNGAKGTNVGTYEALYHGLADGGKGLDYGARYAYAMRQSGLDHPYQGEMPITTRGARILGAVITIVLLAIVFGASKLLQASFAVFSWINPFKAIGYLASDKTVTSSSVWQPIMDIARPIYKQIGGIVMVFAILGFMLAITLALTGHSILDQGNGKHQLGRDTVPHAIGSALFKFFRRVFVYVAGPIIIFTFANDFLDDVKDDSDVTSTVAYSQIYGNYVDFAGWVNHSRLALPAKSGSGKANELNLDGTSEFTKEYIQQINADGAGNSVANEVYQLSKSGKDSFGSNKQDTEAFSDTMGFLMNYLSGATYNGTSWQDKARSIWKQQAAKAKDGDAVKNPFCELKFNNGKANTWNTKGKGYDNYDQDDKDPMNVSTKINDNPYLSDYSLTYKPSDGYYTSNAPSYLSAADLGSSKNAGLSTVGMYNYLNTIADGAGVYYTKPTSFLGVTSINQHASVGFVGRGFLFIANYLLMNIIMLTSAIILAFACVVVLQGAISGIPRMLIYALELASLRWEGLLNILKECISMYARLVLAMVIVSMFTDVVNSVFKKLEELLITGNGSQKPVFSTLALGHQSINMMPFQVNTAVLSIVRIIECAALILLMFMLLKSWRDIIKFIDTMLKRIFGGYVGSREMMHMNPNKANANQNTNKGGNIDSNRKDDSGLDNGNDANSYEEMKKKRQDALQQDDAKNPSLKDRIKANAGLEGLKALDKFDNSKAGKALKGAAKGAMANLGGSKLGRMLGLKGRGDGASKIEKAEKLARQGLANAADPRTSNNSAKATKTQKEQQHDEAIEQKERQDAAEKSLTQASKDLEKKTLNEQKQLDDDNKKKNQLPDQINKDGTLKDTANAAEMLDTTNSAMKDMAKDHSERNASATSQKLEDTMAAYHKNALQEANKQHQDENQAAQDSQQADQELESAKQDEQEQKENVQNLESHAQNGDVAAQKALPKARKNLQKATENRKQAAKNANRAHRRQDKMAIAHNNELRSQIENATGKDVGKNGKNLRQLSRKDRQLAKDLQFTALTGKKAPTKTNSSGQKIDKQGNVVEASPEMIEKAQHAKAQALKTLGDQNATEAEKQDAEKTLHDADVVTTTGYQYGQFTNGKTQPDYDNATSEQKAYADSKSAITRVAATTGYTIGKKAPELNSMEKSAIKQVANAQSIVQTGHTLEGKVATSQQIVSARSTLSNNDPVKHIQNRMINTTTSVVQSAGQEAVAQIMQEHPEYTTAPPMNSPEVQQLVTEKLQQPRYMSQLQSAGIVSTNATPQQVVHQVQHVQELNDQTKAAMKASFAPLVRQVNARGGFKSTATPTVQVTRKIIREASVNEVNNMHAKSTWVDAPHYQKTTYGQVNNAVKRLLDATQNGNANDIARAKVNCRNIGIANSIMNSESNMQKIIGQIQDTKTNVASEALSQSETLQGQSTGM